MHAWDHREMCVKKTSKHSEMQTHADVAGKRRKHMHAVEQRQQAVGWQGQSHLAAAKPKLSPMHSKLALLPLSNLHPSLKCHSYAYSILIT